MPSTISLLNKVKIDFPQFIFEPREEFRWSPQENTIYYSRETQDDASLLHEIAHAVLNHTTYSKDVQLIEMERDAWEYAQTRLAIRYNISIDAHQIEDSIDTYRDWLHTRSICPNCQATGFQGKKNLYKCIACTTVWRVNDARSCALRRYIDTGSK